MGIWDGNVKLFYFPQSPGGHVHGLGYAPNVARALNAPIKVESHRLRVAIEAKK
jgi:hypothetical protein